MDEILDRARALRPAIRAREDEIAEKRRLPPDLVDKLRETGVFDVAVPRAWGGPELDVPAQFAVFEELAYANGSVGWCAMIGCDSGYYPAFMDEEAGRALFPRLGLVTAGLMQPAGTATKVDGGYRVSGRWRFGSGITHADRIVGGAIVVDGDGNVLPGDMEGLPLWRTLFLPVEQVEIIDVWHTTGLEGSGSNDYQVTDAFVPDEHAFFPMGPARWTGPMRDLPWWFIVKVAAVPLGIGRRAIDDFVELAGTKLLFPSMAPLNSEVRSQQAAARAEALVSSAKAFLDEAVGSAWDTLTAGAETTARQRARLRLAMHNAVEMTREAVALLYDTATTSAVYQPNSLDQALRDLTTIAQHVTMSSRNLEPAGRVVLGLDADSVMF